MTRITNRTRVSFFMNSELKISDLKKYPKSIEKIIPKKTKKSPTNHEMLKDNLFTKKE
tara:strand:+ start:1356 stop:1529 length:174 start_codon:yes stop_codon:yes gene_type:complete